MFIHAPNCQRNAVQDVDRPIFDGLTMAVLTLQFCLAVSFGLKLGFLLMTCGFPFTLNSVTSASRHLQLTTKLLCSHCHDSPQTLCTSCLFSFFKFSLPKVMHLLCFSVPIGRLPICVILYTYGFKFFLAGTYVLSSVSYPWFCFLLCLGKLLACLGWRLCPT